MDNEDGVGGEEIHRKDAKGAKEKRAWIPAFAGMTKGTGMTPRDTRGGNDNDCALCGTVIIFLLLRASISKFHNIPS